MINYSTLFKPFIFVFIGMMSLAVFARRTAPHRTNSISPITFGLSNPIDCTPLITKKGHAWPPDRRCLTSLSPQKVAVKRLNFITMNLIWISPFFSRRNMNRKKQFRIFENACSPRNPRCINCGPVRHRQERYPDRNGPFRHVEGRGPRRLGLSSGPPHSDIKATFMGLLAKSLRKQSHHICRRQGTINSHVPLHRRDHRRPCNFYYREHCFFGVTVGAQSSLAELGVESFR